MLERVFLCLNFTKKVIFMNKRSNLFILIFLGIIWSSFSAFTKISAEVLSPFFVSFSRLFLGGICIYGVCLFRGKNIFVVKNFKYYAIVGFFNFALPFILFSYSSRNLDSSIVAILDGTVPMFEVLISIFFLKRFVDKNAIWGVFFGIVGIIVTSYGASEVDVTLSQIFSAFLILTATCSYAGTSLYINAKCKNIEPLVLAAGSVIFSAILLSPSLFFADLSVINFKVATPLLGLGLFCTGIAYIFYFQIMLDEGPRKAVSVVLLIPVFGTILGAFFLGEVITMSKIIGCVTILVSLKFILNLSHQSFFKSKNAPAV